MDYNEKVDVFSFGIVMCEVSSAYVCLECDFVIKLKYLKNMANIKAKIIFTLEIDVHVVFASRVSTSDS